MTSRPIAPAPTSPTVRPASRSPPMPLQQRARGGLRQATGGSEDEGKDVLGDVGRVDVPNGRPGSLPVDDRRLEPVVDPDGVELDPLDAVVQRGTDFLRLAVVPDDRARVRRVSDDDTAATRHGLRQPGGAMRADPDGRSGIASPTMLGGWLLDHVPAPRARARRR